MSALNMQLSRPLLPAEYIKKVLSDDAMRDFQSSVFESDAHQFHVEMQSWIKPRSPNSPFAFQDRAASFTAEARRTYLHLYTSEGDVLALSELLYSSQGWWIWIHPKEQAVCTLCVGSAHPDRAACECQHHDWGWFSFESFVRLEGLGCEYFAPQAQSHTLSRFRILFYITN